MLSSIRRFLPSANTIVVGGSGALIVTALFLRTVPRTSSRQRPSWSDTVELRDRTFTEHELAREMWGRSKVVIRNCNIRVGDSHPTAGHFDELDLDQLYELPSCTCRRLTLWCGGEELGSFVQTHRVQQLSLMDWSAIASLPNVPDMPVEVRATTGIPNYDMLRTVSRERKIDIYLGNNPHCFCQLASNLAFDSNCHLFLTDPAILDDDGVRVAIADHHTKFAHLAIPPSHYEWPFLTSSHLGLEWSRLS